MLILLNLLGQRTRNLGNIPVVLEPFLDCSLASLLHYYSQIYSKLIDNRISGVKLISLGKFAASFSRT
jgi:hypothetical protein